MDVLRSRPRMIALVAGLVYPFAFAPYHLWPLIFLSLALFAVTLQGASPRQAFARGWLFGLGLFAMGVPWIAVSMHDYGFTPWSLAVPLTALFAAAMALFIALSSYLTVRLAGPRPGPVALATGWVLGDAFRGWFLTGFPWLYAGYAVIDTPLKGLATLGGVWLVTLATALAAFALGLAFYHRRGVLPAAGLFLALLITGALTHPGHWVHIDRQHPVKLALVQGDIPQDLKWQLTMQDVTRDIYRKLTADLPADHLVIWPEAAIPEFYQDEKDYLDGEGKAVADKGGALIAGIPWAEGTPENPIYHNSVVVLGGGHGVYHKQRLVPFGEYVPLQNLLRGLIPFFDLPASSFTPGRPGQPNLHALGLTVAPFICYEVLYPDLVARRSHGSNLLLTISNDAWFGRTSGPHQHFEMARMRTLETGRYLVRDTNTGITAIVDPEGRVTKRLPQFIRGVLFGTVYPASGSTPFMVAGAWPVWGLCLLILAGIAYRYRRAYQPSATHS